MAVTAPELEDRGAPAVHMVTNPTMWLFVAFIILMAISTAGYLLGWVGWAIAIPAGILGRYIGFTVMHESTHRVADRRPWLNDALAALPAITLTFQPMMFRTVHLRHHAKTNDPEADPDFNVSLNPAALRLLWLTSPLWTYRKLWFGQKWYKSPKQATKQIALDALQITVVVAAIATGNIVALMVAGIIPLFIAGWILTYAFDYLPHKPHTSTERFYDTNARPSKVWNVILLGQNYHLVHHVWASVPFWKYQRVFFKRRDELIAIGAPIVE